MLSVTKDPLADGTKKYMYGIHLPYNTFQYGLTYELKTQLK
jgi:hypothetical protein